MLANELDERCSVLRLTEQCSSHVALTSELQAPPPVMRDPFSFRGFVEELYVTVKGSFRVLKSSIPTDQWAISLNMVFALENVPSGRSPEQTVFST